MKYFLLTLFCLVIVFIADAQVKNIGQPVKIVMPKNLNLKIKYDSAAGDPLKTRIYTLPNGFKVFMSVNKNQPRIQTYIAVRTGSKNDPADATGLAHYLEHMLFKGTDKFGTANYEMEKTYLDKIEELYELYIVTKEAPRRKAIYHQIDSLSGIAAKYAIANEYDKMVASIGVKGSNAYTWFDQTVYIADIPNNQFNKWLQIEAERFRKPVMRIFHTELEAVYEEKNISLESDEDKQTDELFRLLFKNHTYGTQTTIGTIEHLKNPSIKKIREYYDTYYVANNMALCMSGDFNPDSAIFSIAKTFGSMPARPVKQFSGQPEEPIAVPLESSVYGEEVESAMIGYRFPGASHPDLPMVNLINEMLSNGVAGLIDLNINQTQKAHDAYSQVMEMADYSVQILGGYNLEGQKPEDVKALLLNEIGKLKSGDFPDWLISGSIASLKLKFMKELETNENIAGLFVGSFVKNVPWTNYINQLKSLENVTKQQVIDFVNKNYTNNYVAVYKRKGEDKNLVKVDKPEITPVEVNREQKSEFYKDLEKQPVSPVNPRYIDLKKDIASFTCANNQQVLYVQNVTNNLFTIEFKYNFGSGNDALWQTAIKLLTYCGTSKLSANEIKRELFKSGCVLETKADDFSLNIRLSGLNTGFSNSLSLLKSILKEAQISEEDYKNFIANLIQEQNDLQLDKHEVLYKGLYNYALYGAEYAQIVNFPHSKLKNLKSAEVVQYIRLLGELNHTVLVYSPFAKDDVAVILNKEFENSPTKEYTISNKLMVKNQDKTKVFVYDFPGMKQADILYISKGNNFDSTLIAPVQLYNDYFGGGMASIVFQTLRESKALAYSTRAVYQIPKIKNQPFIMHAFIGTQSDKLPEAMPAMMDLLENMPASNAVFESAKASELQRLKTERYNGMNLLEYVYNNRQLGLTTDVRESAYKYIGSAQMSSIEQAQKKYIKGKNYNIMVLGSKENLDLNVLKKYGEITHLDFKTVFGF